MPHGQACVGKVIDGWNLEEQITNQSCKMKSEIASATNPKPPSSCSSKVPPWPGGSAVTNESNNKVNDQNLDQTAQNSASSSGSLSTSQDSITDRESRSCPRKLPQQSSYRVGFDGSVVQFAEEVPIACEAIDTNT